MTPNWLRVLPELRKLDFHVLNQVVDKGYVVHSDPECVESGLSDRRAEAGALHEGTHKIEIGPLMGH